MTKLLLDAIVVIAALAVQVATLAAIFGAPMFLYLANGGN